MPTRSVLGLLYTAKAFREMGHDVDPIMKRHGLPMDHLDATARIERSKELEVLQDIFALDPNPIHGLNIGKAMGLAGYGPLSMLLMTCKNAYEACQTGIKYQALAYLFGDIRLELGPKESALIIEPMHIPEAISTYVLLRDMVGTYRFIRDIYQMNDKPLQLCEVYLSCEPLADIHAFQQTFECPVHFRQDQNKLTLETRYLKAPFPQANPNAYEMYKAQCDQIMLHASARDEELASALHRYLGMFSYDIPSVVEAAATFGMSERTFRRQLRAEDSSYQQVLDAVRYEKARHWLRESKLPIEDIAGKLGYQEAAAFNHAFKRWSGITPSQYRKQNTEVQT